MSITLSEENNKVKLLFHGFAGNRGFSKYVEEKDLLQAVAHYFNLKEHDKKKCPLCTGD